MELLALVVAICCVAMTGTHVAEVVTRLRGRARHRLLARRCHQLQLEVEDLRRELIRKHIGAPAGIVRTAGGSTPPLLAQEVQRPELSSWEGGS